MAETVKTFCRNCGAHRSMEIDVEDGRMIAARPVGSVSPHGITLPVSLLREVPSEGVTGALFNLNRTDSMPARREHLAKT